MENQNRHPVLLFIQMTRPLFLVGGLLLYALGVGIARYLGATIDWQAYWLGQIWVTLLQLSTHYLNEYYDAAEDQTNRNRTPFTGGSGAVGPGRLTRRTALMAAMTALAFLASDTVLLISQVGLEPVTVAIMVVAFLGSFFYSAPPIRLARTGYGELTTSVLVAYLVPAFGFILQEGELHRLVAMAALPLTVLLLAMLLAFELPDYANDVKREKHTLLVRLGWQTGMGLHNILVLSAFFLLALAIAFGLPLFIALPAFLPLPLALLQVWQMRRIAAGAKPNWKALTLNALTLFGATAYLLTFAFWIN